MTPREGEGGPKTRGEGFQEAFWARHRKKGLSEEEILTKWVNFLDGLAG